MNNAKPSGKVEKMGLCELQATYERQRKILSNKKFLEKLPDKGQKIQESCHVLEKRIEELERLSKQHNPAEGLSEMFSSLSVGGNSANIDINQMEWTGKVPHEIKPSESEVTARDDSDDEKDVVKILATTNQLSKIVIDERSRTPETSEEPAPQKVTPSKFSEVLKLASTVQEADNSFKPFRSLKHEKICKGTYFKENTAATPPIYKYDHSVPLPLEESLELQQNVVAKMKEHEMQRFGIPLDKRKVTSNLVDLSQANPDFGQIHSDEEDEVYDDEGAHVEPAIVVHFSS